MEAVSPSRKKRRVLRAALMIMLLVSTSLAFPTSASAQPASWTPEFTCDPVHEGVQDWDGDWAWVCVCIWDNHAPTHLICEWAPLGVIVADHTLVYYSTTYGHTKLVTGFDSNPDKASAMTHSRNPNGTTRVQGSGELRSRVILQKWNGSAWVNCKDSGYSYSSGAMSEWARSYNMGTAADCGAGTYRVLSYGHMYDAGWRGNHIYTATCYRD